MIQRVIQNKLAQLTEKFPVVSVTGPRQSGKTTLLKSIFPGYRYESLEEPDTRLFAMTDPRKFLEVDKKMIIDEIQRVPELFSYIQSITDKSNINGQYIISGSQSFLLNKHISQSLAGRVAILNLMPLSLFELRRHGVFLPEYEKILFQGFYPRLYDKNIEPVDFYPNYIQTYIERDVRLLQNIHDLTLFIRFLKLCAGRIGQLLNLHSLANDCGVSPNTAKSWISVLESSYIIFLLQPHFKNFNKRLVKMPKLFFIDTGLASSLLEIQSENQVSSHYLRGVLFENFIISEFLKTRLNHGLRSNCYFWRDNKGIEIDCIIENGDKLTPIEIKSGQTFNQDFFKNLNYWNKLSGNSVENSYVVYGGDLSRTTKDGNLLSWNDLGEIPIS
jgi:predicted AAA+ superfamily ATPase